MISSNKNFTFKFSRICGAGRFRPRVVLDKMGRVQWDIAPLTQKAGLLLAYLTPSVVSGTFGDQVGDIRESEIVFDTLTRDL